MSLGRAAPTSMRLRRARSSSVSSSASSTQHPKKRLKRSSLSEAEDTPKLLKVYVVQAKLDLETITELYALLEGSQKSQQIPDHSEDSDHQLKLVLCPEVVNADVIITGLHMKRRLERHINWELAKQKSIVTPQWLRDSVERGHPVPCGAYAAFSELQEETTKYCPDGHDSQPSSSSQHAALPPTYLNSPPAIQPTDPRVYRNWKARFVCRRACPLICPNQALAVELSVLCRDRELEGLGVNALAYQRAIAMIKSYPLLITRDNFETEVSKLTGLGEKMLYKIEEFLDNGYIEETKTTRDSQRYQSLSAFATIYGVGPSKAQEFYDMGMRTIEDMARYYDVDPDTSNVPALRAGLFTPNGKRIPPTGKAPDISIPVALVLRHELDELIPREEVEEIRDVVMRELEGLQPGCIHTIVGGYRRGKPLSNDVDIIITHRDLKSGDDLVRGLCKRLTAQLHNKGLVTHVMHLSGFHAHNALRTENWDSLEKALTVFRLPPDAKHGKGLHRRLDLIFAAPESYWTAVIGWTGSKMFQRDLRLWAKQEKGMKFDSSALTRRHDSKLFFPKSEKEVFDILGLDWIDPTMRNADA